jgi:hypothetical protein
VIYCILAQIVIIVASFAVPPELAIVLGVANLVVRVVAAVFMFRLALVLYGTGWGIAWGIATLVPLIGLIALLVVNAKATGMLKARGIKVVPDPEPGATDAEEKDTAPIPVGSVLSGIASTESATFEPNEPDPTRLSVSDHVALLPSVGASDSVAAAVIVKSRVTAPICSANGWYLTVRYGLPASPRTQAV